MAKEKEMNLLNIENTQDNKDVLSTQDNEEAIIDKQKASKKDTKETGNTQDNKEVLSTQDNAVQKKEYKSLEDYKNSLNPQEKKILEKFMLSPVFDSFVTYLETFFREKDTIIHRINCYCFRAKENVNIRIHGKIYQIKQNEVVYVQKDSFGNAMLRNNKLERII